jgi:hypothetical protein
MRLGITAAARNALRTARTAAILASGGGPGPNGPLKVFVVGSGRSGTHWLGYLLAAFPSTHVTVEKKPIFPWVVAMAQDPSKEAELFPRLARAYRWEHASVLPNHYVDKSHPNLWLAGRLAAEFPEARFVAIWRRLEGTVASMIKHDGVRHWVEAWDDDPRPNRFLGVSEDFIPAYRGMSVPARCAVRVVAHAREIDRLAQVLGRRLLVVEYEGLHSRTDDEVRRLADFMGCTAPAAIPLPKSESLRKWQAQLSPQEIGDIRGVAALLDAEDLLEFPPRGENPS